MKALINLIHFLFRLTLSFESDTNNSSSSSTVVTFDLVGLSVGAYFLFGVKVTKDLKKLKTFELIDSHPLSTFFVSSAFLIFFGLSSSY